MHRLPDIAGSQILPLYNKTFLLKKTYWNEPCFAQKIILSTIPNFFTKQASSKFDYSNLTKGVS